VNFTVGHSGCSAVTDASGHAGCTVNLSELDGPGVTQVSACYPGDLVYEAECAQQSFTISRATTQFFYTGELREDFNDQATLQGRLLVTSGLGQPLPGMQILFTLGSQSCSATTDPFGYATCTITIAQHPGDYSVGASFAGNDDYLGSADVQPFTITKEESQVTYMGSLTADYHDAFTASATLVDPDGGAPIPGKTIQFTLGTGDTCSDTTDASGQASCTITPTQPAGTVALVAGFAGDADYVSNGDSHAFTITREETTATYTGPLVIAQGQPVNLIGISAVQSPRPAVR
jgi:hypothetical protein